MKTEDYNEIDREWLTGLGYEAHKLSHFATGLLERLAKGEGLTDADRQFIRGLAGQVSRRAKDWEDAIP